MNYKLTYVVYSHTDFLDVLTASTGIHKEYENTYLLIEKNDMDLEELYSNYKGVLFYDDTLPYASRLLTLKNLDEDYILLIHENEIIANRDNEVMDYVLEVIKEKDIDRLDLRYKNNPNTKEMILINKNNHSFYLNKQDVHSERKDGMYSNMLYEFNVGAGIWKLSVLMEIMEQFKNEGYRTIESEPTQRFMRAKGYRIFKVYSDEGYLGCGHQNSLPFFVYIHCTHAGVLLPLTERVEKFTEGGQNYYNSNNNLHPSLTNFYKEFIEDSQLDSTRNFDDNFKNFHKHLLGKEIDESELIVVDNKIYQIQGE